MKNFKTILLSLFFTIGFIFPSCKKENLCGGKSIESPRYFDINGLEAVVFQNNKGYKLLEPLDTISFSGTTGIYMTYQADYHSLRLPSFNHTFSLINSTMACSPTIPGYDGSKTEKLENLSIITLNDFDDEHPANSPINDLFEVQSEFFNGEDIQLMEFLQDQTENIKSQELFLILKQAPTSNTAFHFKIIVDLSTGESYETESSIYFKN